MAIPVAHLIDRHIDCEVEVGSDRRRDMFTKSMQGRRAASCFGSRKEKRNRRHQNRGDGARGEYVRISQELCLAQ